MQALPDTRRPSGGRGPTSDLQSVSSALDILFEGTVNVSAARSGLTVQAYVGCYTFVYNTCANGDAAANRLYSWLQHYLAHVCRRIDTSAPRSSEWELVEHYLESYKHYQRAMTYTARLFAYAERYYIPLCRREERLCVQFDPDDLGWEPSGGAADEANIAALVFEILNESEGNPPVGATEELLQVEIASDADRIVGIKALGLRQWRIDIIEPWLRHGGQERLRSELNSNPSTTSIEDILQRLGVTEPSAVGPKALPDPATIKSELLQSADNLLDANYEAAVANFSIDETYLGRDLLLLFVRLLYGSHDDDELYYHTSLDALLPHWIRSHKASDLFERCERIIAFLEGGNSNKTVQDLLTLVQDDPCWRIDEQKKFNEVWYMFCLCLRFHGDVKVRKPTFQGHIQDVFQLSSRQKDKTSFCFTVTLNDLESVQLQVRPTTLLHEHLEVQGDAVKIFKYTGGSLGTLLTYTRNRAARALGIQSLGAEILSSIDTLYGKCDNFKRAQALGIYEQESKVSDSFLSAALSVGEYRDDVPKVLAHRHQTLRRLVDYRRSFWPSLMRDTHKLATDQPFYFYGAIFAIFFGVCSIIQTVTSVWSLVITIRSQGQQCQCQ